MHCSTPGLSIKHTGHSSKPSRTCPADVTRHVLLTTSRVAQYAAPKRAWLHEQTRYAAVQSAGSKPKQGWQAQQHTG